MRFIALSIVVLATAVLLGCPKPTPPPVTPPDATDAASLPDGGTRAERACANLQRLDCSVIDESKGTTCVQLLDRIEADPATRVNALCIAAAQDRGQLKACNVRCL